MSSNLTANYSEPKLEGMEHTGYIFENKTTWRFPNMVLLFCLLLLSPILVRHVEAQQGVKYLNAADQALLKGEFQEAVDNYMRYLSYGTLKERYKIWDDVGYAYLRRNQTKKAVSYLERAKDTKKGNFDSHLYLAAAHFLEGRFKESQDLLSEIEDNVFFDSSWTEMSSDMIKKGEDGGRLSGHEIGRLKKEKGIHLKITEGDSPEAIIHIDAFDPENQGTIYFLKGLNYRGLNDKNNARISFNRALETGYFAPAVRYQLNELKRSTDIPKSETKDIDPPPGQMTKFPLRIHHRLKDHPNNLLWYQHELFFDELKLGRIEEAIQVLEEGLDINSHSYVVNHNLAIIYFDLKDFEKAEYYCARAIWFRPQYQGSYDLMGNLYFQQKRYQEAKLEFQTILDLENTNANAYLNLGSTHYKLGDEKKAEAYWRKAIDLDNNGGPETSDRIPGDAEMDFALVVKKNPISYMAFFFLGNCYYEQKAYGKAISALLSAVSLNPQKSDPHLTLAKAYLEGENQSSETIKEAVKHLNRYLFLGGKEEKEARRLLENIGKKDE
ncbi:tetratricopeptide repeat protein [Acidobacteriota bacterium]